MECKANIILFVKNLINIDFNFRVKRSIKLKTSNLACLLLTYLIKLLSLVIIAPPVNTE